MTLIWILALIVTNAASIAIVIRKKNAAHHKTVQSNNSRNGKTWSEAFDSGWNSATNDAGHIWTTYRKMFNEQAPKI